MYLFVCLLGALKCCISEPDLNINDKGKDIVRKGKTYLVTTSPICYERPEHCNFLVRVFSLWFVEIFTSKPIALRDQNQIVHIVYGGKIWLLIYKGNSNIYNDIIKIGI